MKKTILLSTMGFFIATSTVNGQEQQNKKSDYQKIEVSKKEETTLKKSKAVTAKKVTIQKVEAVNRKKLSNSKEATRKEEK
ncbi:MAG: hypothetical protein COA32_02700 [Fluviicola sp.]|nr:MAG: hypothetical protein COA32_02700 [Fluviicola sp.]